MMVCTAGHVDHGKTRLVNLLTGCQTDRLKEEQERGLTIELGFAPCVLGDGIGVGIVDVPGHEKFIRNMVAGVSGIGMTILVIAANDGVMPQTVEHLRILEFMGVSRGMVALTKTDLVEPYRIREAQEEVREFLKGTFLEGAPVCSVSAETFEGYPEFYSTLAGEVKRLVKQRREGVFRMPVEQVFSRKGQGLVVMGIPIEGTVAIGDQVELVPGGYTGRIRGVQQFGRDTGRGEYGQCLALNIPDLAKTPPLRGQVLGLPGYLSPHCSFHVRLHAVPGLEHPLKNAEEIKFHTGTSEETGKLYLLENKTLAGGSALATVVLNAPAVAAIHDRFIIRRASPATTVAGGEILALSESQEKPRRRQALEQVQAYESVLEGLNPSSPEGMERRVEHLLHANGMRESTAGEVSKGLLLPVEIVIGALSASVERGNVRPLGPDLFIHAASFTRLLGEIKEKLEGAASGTGALTLSMADLQKGSGCSIRLWKAVEEELRREGLVARQGSTLILSGAAENMSEADRNIVEGVLALYEETGFSSPRPEEVPELIGAPEKAVTRLMKYLYGRQMLIRLGENVILSRTAFLNAQDMVVRTILEEGEVDSADFKYQINSSRKYALAILDHLDALRVTIRSGNIRKLSVDYKRRMMQ